MADYSIEVSIPTAAPPGLLSAGTIIEGETATPALRITQTGAGNALVVEDSTHPDSTPLVINNLGQIISGATTAFNDFAGLQMTANSSEAPNANIVIRRCSNDINCSSIASQKSRGTSAARTAVQQNDVLLNIAAGGFDGASTTFSSARIQAIVDGAVSSGVVPTALVVGTGSNNINTERMRIDSAGNVGIGGTADADAILDLQSTTKGFLPPRMTTTQRNDIAAPIPAGLTVYNTTTNKLNFYNGTAWEAVTSG